MTIFVYSSETGYKRTREYDLDAANKVQKTDRYSPDERQKIERAWQVLIHQSICPTNVILEARITMAEAFLDQGMKSQCKNQLRFAMEANETVQDPAAQERILCIYNKMSINRMELDLQ